MADTLNPPVIDPGTASDGPKEALRRYRQGNRLFARQELTGALTQWQAADQLWHAPAVKTPRFAWPHLRAALALLLSVAAVYLLLFGLFPRPPRPMDPTAMQSSQPRNWLDEWLDTGRPPAPPSHKMGMREWWAKFSELMGEGKPGQPGENGPGMRPPLSEKWEQLIHRYGRHGMMETMDLDYSIMAGYGLSGLGDFDASVEVLEKGLTKTRDAERLSEIYQGLANSYYFLGYRLSHGGLAEYDLKLVRKAADAYEQSIAHRPKIGSYGNLGWMYFLLGEYRKAESYSLRALALDPATDYVRLNLGLTYLMEQKFAESHEAYRFVASHHPPDEVFMGGLNDLKEVVRDHGGRHPFAYLMIGYLSINRGDIPQSQTYLRKFVSLPQPGAYWKDLAEGWLANPNSAVEY
ncbi:MAG: tetratricopeptide repeat protein [Deltaproteobacteria bacterium]|nr:tetratricopeptide repeat protein [Deltaproteobacteria bacterium]